MATWSFLLLVIGATDASELRPPAESTCADALATTRNASSPSTLYSAAITCFSVGNTGEAIRLLVRDIDADPTQAGIEKVYFQLAAIFEDSEDWKNAAITYATLETLPGATQRRLAATYKAALMFERAGREREMLAACRRLLDEWQSTDESTRRGDTGSLAGAYCTFRLLEPEWRAYEAIGAGDFIAVSDAERDAIVERKRTASEALANKYAVVQDFGNAEWAVAASLRVADARLAFAGTMRKRQFAAIDEYRRRTGDLACILWDDSAAFAVEDDALRTLDVAMQQAMDHGVYSPFTLAIEARIHLYRPARFGPIVALPLPS